MDCDLYNMLKLWGAQYNQMMNESETPKESKNHNGFFTELPDEFTKQDLIAIINKYGSKTRPVTAIYLWKKTGLIEKLSKGHYRKIKKK